MVVDHPWHFTWSQCELCLCTKFQVCSTLSSGRFWDGGWPPLNEADHPHYSLQSNWKFMFVLCTKDSVVNALFCYIKTHIIHKLSTWCPLVLIYSIAVIAYSEKLARSPLCWNYAICCQNFSMFYTNYVACHLFPSRFVKGYKLESLAWTMHDACHKNTKR